MKKELNGLAQRIEKNYKGIYSQEHYNFVKQVRESGCEWEDVAIAFNERFTDFTNKNADNMRQLYKRYKNTNIEQETSHLDAIKQTFTTQKQNGKIKRDNNIILDAVLTQEQFLNSMKEIVDKLNVSGKGTTTKIVSKSDSKKPEMKKLLHLSDLHFGKLVKHNAYDAKGNATEKVMFDSKIARNRIKEISRATIQAIKNDLRHYNITELVLTLNGDIIESSTMHGLESLIGCEFGNAEQIEFATRCLFEDLFVPLAKLGIKIQALCTAGNHDRVTPEKTYNMPGKNNMTWIIYNMLEMLCKQSNLKNVNFIIAVDSFIVYELFPGYFIVIEHGDLIKAHTKIGLFQQLFKRSQQVGFTINAIIVGHTHDEAVFGRGQAIVNGSMCGQDDYAKCLGYSSGASQGLISYINSKKRKDKFYNIFSIDLTDVF